MVFIKIFLGLLILFSVSVCYANDSVRYMVDARYEYNVTENDIAKLNEYISAVGNGGFDGANWKKERIKELGIKTIYIGNAFNNGAKIVDGKLEFDFFYAYSLAKIAKDAGCDVKFILSSAMPRALSSRPDDKYYMSYPPANWKDYENYIYQIVRYFNVTLAPYGFKVTYWDVQNEPDHTVYWFPNEKAGSKVRYDNLLELYKHTVKAVEKYEKDYPNSPKVKIGGPRLTGATFGYTGDFNWAEQFIKDCASSKTRLDFISLHFYGGGASYNGAYNWSDVLDVPSRLTIINGLIKKYLPNTEIHVTEWGVHEENHTGGRWSYTNAGNEAAAFTPSFLKTLLEHNVAKSFFLELEDRRNPPTSGLDPNVWEMEALYTIDGTPKAIANAFKIIRKMASNRVATSGKNINTDIIASKDSDKITIMVWNNNLFGPDAEKAGDMDVEIDIRGIKNWDKFRVNKYLIDKTHSNAYYYKNNIEEMKKHADLEMVESSILENTKQDVFSLPKFVLNKESFMLIELVKE